MKTNGLLLTGSVLMFNFISALAGPLDNWHWRNPLPNGNPQAGPQTLRSIVFASGKFVAVGDAGVVSISVDSTNWSQGATATTNNLRGLVYAGGKFVAVGDGGTVETSTDATNWVTQNSGTMNSLAAIAYGNGKFVAVGINAVIVSSNTVNWAPAISGLSGATSIAAGSNGFLALLAELYGVAGAPQPNNKAYFSPDGLTWTAETFNVPSVPDGFTLENEMVTYGKGVYMIGGFRYANDTSAEMFVFNSVDGMNWTTNDLGTISTGAGGFSYNFFLTANNYLVAAGAANHVPFLQYSPDGTSWFLTNSIPASLTFYGPTAGAYGNGSYVITGGTDFLYSQPPIFTSTDGINWTNRAQALPGPTGPAYAFSDIASNNGVYVAVSATQAAVSSNGLAYVVASNSPALSAVTAYSGGFVGVGSGGSLYISADGVTWSPRTSGTTSNLHGVTAGNGLLLAVGDNGAIQTSSSGNVWTSRTSGTSLPLYSIVYSNGLYVTVGQQGTVLTSLDGINWAGQFSGVFSNLLSVTCGYFGFIAVGPGGTVVASPDATNWVAENSLGNISLQSVSFGNGYYLAVGNNGTAWSSPDGINWTSRNLGVTGGQNLDGSAFINGRFDVVGSNGTILESDVITPVFDLSLHRTGTQNQFTLLATPGTNFRLQSTASLFSPSWGDIAAFDNVSAATRWTNNAAGPSQQFYRMVSP